MSQSSILSIAIGINASKAIHDIAASTYIA